MVNWKKCKIEKKFYIDWQNSFGFVLDDLISHKDGVNVGIICANSHPFNTYQEGDYIEFDSDRVKQENKSYVLNDINLVRKISSSMTSPVMLW